MKIYYQGYIYRIQQYCIFNKLNTTYEYPCIRQALYGFTYILNNTLLNGVSMLEIRIGHRHSYYDINRTRIGEVSVSNSKKYLLDL